MEHCFMDISCVKETGSSETYWGPENRWYRRTLMNTETTSDVTWENCRCHLEGQGPSSDNKISSLSDCLTIIKHKLWIYDVQVVGVCVCVWRNRAKGVRLIRDSFHSDARWWWNWGWTMNNWDWTLSANHRKISENGGCVGVGIHSEKILLKKGCQDATATNEWQTATNGGNGCLSKYEIVWWIDFLCRLRW